MSHVHHQEPVSRVLLGSALVMVCFALAIVTAARSGLVETPPSPAAARTITRVAPVQVRDLTFADRPDGSLVITDVADGSTAAMIVPGEPSGFIRGVLRGLMRDRKLRQIGIQPPFHLTLWENGALSLDDRSTGRSVELNSFGPDNRAAFMRLLKSPPA